MVDPTKEPEQQHESTAAEYIYKSMIPPKSPHQQNETVEALPSIGKRGRLNTGDSTRSGMMSLGSLRSMDFLTTADVALDGGSGLGLSDTSFNVDRIQSSDIVEQILLPDAAATASAALTTDQSTNSGDDGPPPSPAYHAKLKDCPVTKLIPTLERISTGDSIVPLDENFGRLSSKEWVKDFDDESNPGAMHPSLFMDPSARSLSCKSISTISPIPLNQGGGKGFEEYQVPINGGMPSLSDPNISSPTTRTRSGGATKSKPQKERKENGRRKKPRRIIDEGRVIEPTDDDVFFGRGGYTNTHPGNIKFRNKALELRPWYEASTKEEKFNISQLLIESVKSEGHRFLEKGKDGLWHEVIGNGARKKASQALRERIRGQRRSTTASSKSRVNSSITSVESSASGKNDVPTDVVGV